MCSKIMSIVGSFLPRNIKISVNSEFDFLFYKLQLFYIKCCIPYDSFDVITFVCCCLHFPALFTFLYNHVYIKIFIYLFFCFLEYLPDG